jgi:hypothetical protein
MHLRGIVTPAPRLVGAVAMTALFATLAPGQTPSEQPVPEGMVAGGRLTLPSGGQVSSPDATWEWRMLLVKDTKIFVLVKPGEAGRILVMHRAGVNVNDEFMRGFVDGTLRRSAKQGIEVHGPTFSHVEAPVKGTYRFEATAKAPSGVTYSRVGYVLPSGHIVLMSFQGIAEPPEIMAVASSIEPDDELAK